MRDATVFLPACLNAAAAAAGARALAIAAILAAT
jgi:hypothetical protein